MSDTDADAAHQRAERDALRDEIATEVRKEVVGRVAGWVVGAVVGLVVLAAIGWWAILLPYLKDMIGGVPAGSVVAFDLDRCPNSTWERFTPANGRFLVGADDSMTFRSSAGSATMRLTAANLPPISVTFQVFRSSEGSLTAGGYPFDRFVGGDGKGATGTFRNERASSAGEAEAFSTLPPYLAVTLCKKTG